MGKKITTVATHFLGWGYAKSTGDNRFPVIKGCLPPHLLLQPGDARLIDCSTFITALANYMNPDVEWDDAAYGDMQIFSAERLWSPVDCWVRHGVGTELRANAHADGWGLYQSWIDDQLEEFDGDPISGGHQWAYNAKHQVRLHSSSRNSLGPTLDRGVTWQSLQEYYEAGIRGVAL